MKTCVVGLATFEHSKPQKDTIQPTDIAKSYIYVFKLLRASRYNMQLKICTKIAAARPTTVEAGLAVCEHRRVIKYILIELLHDPNELLTTQHRLT